MSWIDVGRHWLRTMFERDRLAREMDDEMRFHLELEAMDQRADGTPDADDAARRRFGHTSTVREARRDATGLALLDILQQDTRFAWRSLKRNPGLTALVVVTFTLGIGVNASTFTILDSIYLRPPTGVADPGSVHRVWWLDREPGSRTSPASTHPVMSAIRAGLADPDQMVIFDQGSSARLGGTRAGPELTTQFPTANYFQVLGVRPQLGRFFTADEDRIGSGAPVAVLSDHTWRTHFAADSSVIGREIKLDDSRFTVIGVAARGFTGINLEPVDVWMPLASMPDQRTLVGPVIHRYYGTHAFFRATPATNLDEFRQRATSIAHDVIRNSGTGISYATIEAATGPIIYTRGPGVQNQQNLIATRLSGVALIVLIIAAANVVNLLLARAARRRREIAVRLALGVGRWRLARMLTLETLLLALIAAGAALLAAWWGGAALRGLLLPDVKFVEPVVSMRVLWFTLGIATLAGLIAGIVPAIQSTNPDLTRALKENARDGSAPHSRLRTALVVTQAALSVVLLVGASLFIRSLQNVRGLDLGFDVNEVVIGTVGFDPGQDPPLPVRSAAIARIAERMAGRTGVLSTSRSASVPMNGASYGPFWFDNDSSESFLKHRITYYAVDEKYFVTAGIRIVAGRPMDNRRGAPPEVVVNQDMAALLWPGREPLGQCLRLESATSACYSVVGVVESSRTMSVVEEARPQYFLPQANMTGLRSDDRHANPTVLIVRTTPALASGVVADVAAELKREFPTGYPNSRVMASTLDDDYRPWRVGALLFSGFGVLALIVAMLGIYSTVSYGVSQRTHEFGIRIALGARIADVLRLVLGQGLRTVAIGVVAGIALALAAGRLVASLLYGVQPSDPTVMVTVSLALLAVAALAALMPAWRASRVDPTTALRAD